MGHVVLCLVVGQYYLMLLIFLFAGEFKINSISTRRPGEVGCLDFIHYVSTNK
jgi:hypothetical protein